MYLVRRSLGKIGCGVKLSGLTLKQPGRCPARLRCTLMCAAPNPMHSANFATARRALAILGCIALLYFAGGGAFVHQHSGGADNVCHVCQALHMPALAAAALDLIPEARQIAWHAVLPDKVSPLDPFALHRASRGPPSA